jgi:putative inorganic carbon (HCO3(-)) transporter
LGRENLKRYTGIRILFLIVLGTNISCLWFTRSFAGLASFMFGIILFFIFMKIRGKGRQPRRARILFIILGVCVLTLFAILFVNRYIYGERAHSLSVALGDRIIFWRTAIQAISERPFAFTGLGNFGSVYRIYAPFVGIESRMAHNLFLQLWVETGIYGLLAFIWFIAVLIFNAVKDILSKETPNDAAIIKIGLLSAVSAFLFHNMAGFSFFVPQVAAAWWILCSFIARPFSLPDPGQKKGLKDI